MAGTETREERGAGIPGGVGVEEEGDAEEATVEKMHSLTASFELSGAFGLRNFRGGLGAEYIWAAFLQAVGIDHRL